MKKSDFLALPVGTTVLLRPSGGGSRGLGAENELILATIDNNETYLPSSRRWGGSGFAPSPRGEHRAVSIGARLPEHCTSDAPDEWFTPGTADVTFKAARGVIGVWEEVRERVLAERRAYFALRAEAKQAASDRRSKAREQFDATKESIRPSLEAAGIDTGKHRAFTPHAAPGDRHFTVAEVAKIVAALQEATPHE